MRGYGYGRARRCMVVHPDRTQCIQFYIELLNQWVSVHKYEGTLVCALAVLGCQPESWHDTDNLGGGNDRS